MPSLLKRLALCATPLVFAFACTGSEKKSDASDTGGTVIVIVASEPTSLLPPLMTGTFDKAVVNSLFDHLAEIGDSLNTVGDVGFTPRLANSWTWAKDSLSIAFHLDPRARWHDGKPVNAADVKFSFQVYADSSSGSNFVSLMSNVDSVSVSDSLTAIFWYKRRTPQQFYDVTFNMYVLPSHVLTGVAMKDLGMHPFGRKPVGSGRFRFVRWDPKQRIEMVADTGNFRGRAKLDRVIWSLAPDNGAATIKLTSDEGDFLQDFPPENIPQLASYPQLRLVPTMTFGYGYLGLNLRSQSDKSQPHPVLGDVRVRRALSMAMDRDLLTQSVFGTLATTVNGPAPSTLFPWYGEIKTIKFDVAHAKALLDSAGWKTESNGGMRSKDGKPLAFEILASSKYTARVNYATLMQNQLAAIGVKVSVLATIGDNIKPRVLGGKFDAYLTGLGMDPGMLGMPQTWTTSAIGGLNFSAYSNPRFDALLDSAITTSSASRAHTLWVRAFQQIVDDAPAVWLYEERSAVVMHKRIQMPPVRPDGLYGKIADWTIDPTMRIKRDQLGLGAAR